jgi:electron transport complex, RnfABCDGE type, B subunit
VEDMDYMSIVYAVLVLGFLGMLFGVLLGYASKKFEVQVDAKIPKIRAVLPGANCGGCGYPGCDAYAAAIVESGASLTACAVGGAACASKIAEIVGTAIEKTVTTMVKKTAFVKCSGDCSSRKVKSDLKDTKTCAEAAALEGVEGCSYGCLGLGCCTKACKFGAISVIDGVAVVDEEKCVNCGACIKACPKGLIESIPVDKKYRVACNSKDVGKTVRENCSKGCIACRLCEKNCPSQAITVNDNLAAVDYSKCVSCGICATKCPVKVITGTRREQPQAV